METEMDIYNEELVGNLFSKDEIVDRTQFLAREINSDIEYFKYDSILQKLGCYAIKTSYKGFTMIGTGPKRIYKYSTYNIGVLKAIAFNMRTNINASDIEKARIILAIKALAADLLF